MVTNLKVGDKAPDFELDSTLGRKVSVREFANKKSVVLYFYPKDNTPGCTKEACSFRDDFARFQELGAEILEVSLDSIESHEKFSSKHHLPFVLLSDKDKQVVKAYGVLGLGGFSAKRVTFIIDKAGVITHVFPKVNVSKHSEEVMDALREVA